MLLDELTNDIYVLNLELDKVDEKKHNELRRLFDLIRELKYTLEDGKND